MTPMVVVVFPKDGDSVFVYGPFTDKDSAAAFMADIRDDCEMCELNTP